MSENKRYYWLQLKKDFFKTRAMKKLRSIAGGDTYTIIYLKMQLLSLENGGFLFHEGVEEDMIEEVALDIDESIDNVKMTFQFLLKCNLIELKDDQMYLPEVNENTGSETASAQRVRRFRATRAQKALQCNTNVISGNVELETELYNKSNNIMADFDLFWDAYSKKEKRKDCVVKFKKKYSIMPDIESHVEIIKKWHKTRKWQEGYQPDPLTWLNGERWEDEIQASEIILSEEEQKADIRREIEERRKRA